MNLPARYAFLNAIGTLPRMVSVALGELGTVETPGAGNTPRIMQWADAVGIERIGYKYSGDSVPWCGLFMAWVALKAGKPVPAGPLYALNWGAFGGKAHQPLLGDVLTFVRPSGGHVGLYIGESASTYHVLGGNQSDSVSITEIAKTRLRAVRRPPMSVPPASMKPWLIGASGLVSRNEA